MSGIQGRPFRVFLFAATMLAVMACSSPSSEKDNVLRRAEKGDAKAQFDLGLKYENGEGVLQDYAEAAKWYRKAAEQGYAKAQFNLGTMYDEGRGVRQDFAEAAKWYRKAKDQGVANASNFSGTGMAWWYRKYAKEQSHEDQGRYEFAEKEAKAKKTGLCGKIRTRNRRGSSGRSAWTIDELGEVAHSEVARTARAVYLRHEGNGITLPPHG